VATPEILPNPVPAPKRSVVMAASAESGVSPFVPVKGHTGFHYKAVPVEEATPEGYVPGPGAASAESNFILPVPALVSANAPSILAAMSSPNEFDDSWKLRASFTSNQAQRIGKASLDLMFWVPSVMKDGIVVVFRSDQLLLKNMNEQ
jgi:hypothetical protein